MPRQNWLSLNNSFHIKIFSLKLFLYTGKAGINNNKTRENNKTKTTQKPIETPNRISFSYYPAWIQSASACLKGQNCGCKTWIE